jgi:hypothetical protein
MTGAAFTEIWVVVEAGAGLVARNSAGDITITTLGRRSKAPKTLTTAPVVQGSPSFARRTSALEGIAATVLRDGRRKTKNEHVLPHFAL